MAIQTNSKKNDDVIEIDVLEILGIIMHKIWLILLVGAVFGIAAFVCSNFIITPKYESSTGIYVLSRQNGDTVSYSDTQLATQLTKDYEELIVCRTVLESVINECELDDNYKKLNKRVAISHKTDTRIIYITVKDESPEEAQRIANCIREFAAEHITAVTDVEAVNVVDEANLPDEPSEPSVMKWTVIGALIGVLLMTAIIVIRYLLDDTIKTADDVENYLELSTLALIPVFEAEKDGKKKGTSKRKQPSSQMTDRLAKETPVRTRPAGATDIRQVAPRPAAGNVAVSATSNADVAKPAKRLNDSEIADAILESISIPTEEAED